MKKTSSLLFLTCLATSLLLPSVVAPSSAYAADKINVEINGAALLTEQDPFVHNSRTFVPLRSIFEALGASIDWNATTRTVTSTKGDITIQLTLGSNIAYRNGAPVELDAAPMVVSDRSYVPVRFIAESFNTPVKWDGATKTVRLLESNRAELEEIMTRQVTELPTSFHLDYVGNYTSRQNGKGYIGTRTANVDFSYDLDQDTSNYHGTWKQIGDLFRGMKDFDLYVTGDRAYVQYAGMQTWQTASLTNAPNIQNSIVNRAHIPLFQVPVTHAKYAVLEQTETDNIVTVYMSADTYRQLQAKDGVVVPTTMQKVKFKYYLNKETNFFNKLEAWQTSKYPDGQEVITYEIFTYSKVAQPYTLTLPQGAYQAKEADLSKLY